MREIKFRVWHEVDKMMFDVSELSFRAGGIHFNGPGVGDGWCTSDMPQVEKTCTLMQFTGLTDKNGKDIYEGDIYYQGDKNILYVVVWHDTGLIGHQVGSSSYAGLTYWNDKIEVIGNVYENPELIEDGAKSSAIHRLTAPGQNDKSGE